MDNYAAKLHLSDVLRKPLIQSITQSLRLPRGSKGLDIGCGIGSNTMILAESVGKAGNIIGIDLSEELLAHATRRAKKAHLSHQLFFQKGDMYHLSFSDNTFDWAWSMDCAGYAPGEKICLLKEIARVVKPGGDVFIAAWSSQQLLPGYPKLEARLNATSRGIAPFVEGQPPETHFLSALGWFRTAGYKKCKVRTFAGNAQAPLNKEKRRALLSLCDMRWGIPESELTTDEWAEYQRLCHPDSPECLFASPDYYGFFTYTLFNAKTVD